MRHILSLALLLVSSMASAQVYKCTHAGQVAYQDTPCATGEQTTKVDVGEDPVTDLVGCYSATLRPWRASDASDFMIEIRLTSDGYELRTLGHLYKQYSQTFAMRRATRHELDEVEAVTRTRLRAGLTVKWDPYTEPVPVGVYKGKDGDGHPIYLVYFRNGSGPGLKMVCP